MSEYNSNIKFFECDCGAEVYPSKHSKNAEKELKVRIAKKHTPIYSSAGNPSFIDDQTEFDDAVKAKTKKHMDDRKSKFKGFVEKSSPDYTEITYERHESVVNETYALDGRPKKVEWMCPLCGMVLAKTEWKSRV